MRCAFIEQHCDSYPLLCAALQVSDSGFATWQRGEGPTKWLSDGALLQRIREIHEQTKAAYGSPRIYQELNGRGIPVSQGRVERLMRENDLRGRHKRWFKATTDSKHSLPVAPNRLDQDFETAGPDQVWTADLTDITTGEGWLYLAVVLDLYTRQIVGWAMRERMTKELVIDALRMAWFRRRPQAGLSEIPDFHPELLFMHPMVVRRFHCIRIAGHGTARTRNGYLRRPSPGRTPPFVGTRGRRPDTTAWLPRPHAASPPPSHASRPDSRRSSRCRSAHPGQGTRHP